MFSSGRTLTNWENPGVVFCAENCYIFYAMRYAIIADIHANLAAFDAVRQDMESQGGVEEIWCLGDVVGYGPDPGACLERLCRYRHVCVAGNHDWGAVGKVDLGLFNPDAAAACRWTAGRLTPAEKAYLAGLPTVVEKGEFTLAHGSPREPIGEYIISASIARVNADYFQTPYCLVGHTHQPAVYRFEGEGCSGSRFLPNVGLLLGKNRLIINPGSVGQPRDGDPRASYALYDREARMVRLRRVPYDLEATQSRMLQAGLPVHLVTRLGQGV